MAQQGTLLNTVMTYMGTESKKEWRYMYTHTHTHTHTHDSLCYTAETNITL